MTTKKKLRAPKQYRAPLRSRKAMIDYLLAGPGHCHGYDQYLFAFNVKVYDIDLDFDHLLRQYVDDGQTSEAFDYWIGNPEFLAKIRKEHARQENNLFDWGQEGAWETVENDEAYTSLWSGENVAVKYDRFGRSSGYIVITELEGKKFSGREGMDEYRYWLEAMGTHQLRKVYQFIVQCRADFTPAAAKEEIQIRAAVAFFEGVVDRMLPPLPSANVGAGI